MLATRLIVRGQSGSPPQPESLEQGDVATLAALIPNPTKTSPQLTPFRANYGLLSQPFIRTK